MPDSVDGGPRAGGFDLTKTSKPGNGPPPDVLKPFSITGSGRNGSSGRSCRGGLALTRNNHDPQNMEECLEHR
jgi:hypothetical protein